MRKFTPHFILTTLLFLTVTANSQTVINGDFELWPPACPYNVAPNSWTNFSNSLGPDQAGTCAGIVPSYTGISHMNLVWANYPLMEGAKQAMSGLTIGNVYQVSFYACHDQGLYAFTGSLFLDFYHNSTVIFSTPELFNLAPWTLYTANFTALTATDTIGFQIRAGTTNTSGSVGVDAVSIGLETSVAPDLSEINFSLYPNPSNGIFTLQSDEEITSIEICNTLGETIFNQQISKSSNHLIDLSSQSKGIYFVKIMIGGKSAVQKLVIQ